MTTSPYGILSGVEKTAVLLNVLGKERAFNIFKQMKDGDVRRLIRVMGDMKKAPVSLINSVLHEFLDKLSEKDEIIFEENMNEMKLIAEALGEERAKQIFGGESPQSAKQKQLTVLDSVDSKKLIGFLLGEHPQTIALIVSHMALEKQTEAIKQLPEAIRVDVMARLATLDYVDPTRIEELDDLLRRELLESGKSLDTNLGGLPVVGQIVNNLDRKTMNSVMTRMEEKDPKLAEQIRKFLLQFTDIVKIESRAVQMILRDVPPDKLLLALKSAPDEVREKIFAAMSQRAAEMLRDDLGALGPQKVADVEAAQKVIVNVMKRLQDEGKITIGSNEEQELIP